MLVIVISIIEWAKLIVGLTFVLIGFWSVLRPFLCWTTNKAPPVLTAIGIIAELLTGLAMTLAGFYIAGW